MAVPSSLLNGAPPRWGLTFSQNWGKFDESVSGSQLHPVLLEKRRVGIWGALLGGLHMWGDALWQVRLCTKTFWLVQSNAGKDWSPLTLLYNRAKNPEVVERVQRGQILSQPGNCPIKVYEVRPTLQDPPSHPRNPKPTTPLSPLTPLCRWWGCAGQRFLRTDQASGLSRSNCQASLRLLNFRFSDQGNRLQRTFWELWWRSCVWISYDKSSNENKWEKVRSSSSNPPLAQFSCDKFLTFNLTVSCAHVIHLLSNKDISQKVKVPYSMNIIHCSGFNTFYPFWLLSVDSVGLQLGFWLCPGRQVAWVKLYLGHLFFAMSHRALSMCW